MGFQNLRTGVAHRVDGVAHAVDQAAAVAALLADDLAQELADLVVVGRILDIFQNLGFSHPVEVEDTDTIKIELKDALHFSITGIDKQEVGQFAAEVRGVRPPEPYKGKGIRYVGEYVIRKEGKAGKGK